MLILLYTVLHFLTEGFAAFSMISRFSGGLVRHGQFYYHFAVLALPLVIGTALDLILSKRKNEEKKALPFPELFAAGGLLLLLIGAVTHPFLLGLGNAFFKTGAVAAVLSIDREKHKKGALVGLFLAPSAVALFLGKLLGAYLPAGSYFLIFGLFAAVAAALALLLVRAGFGRIKYHESAAYKEAMEALSEHEKEFRLGSQPKLTGRAVFAIILCFAAVALRSFFDAGISYSWSEDLALVAVASAALSIGVLAGGYFAAKTSFTVGILFPLAIAAFLFWFKDIPVFAIMAIFLFHMSVPVTLYMVSNRLKEMPGYAWGLLSFAEFLGLLPVFFGVQAPFPEHILAAAVAAAVLILLFIGLVLFVKEFNASKKA